MKADIRDFTALSNRIPADQIFTMLNEFFERCVSIVFKYDGILDKYFFHYL
jgi:adenylate cyclase